MATNINNTINPQDLQAEADWLKRVIPVLQNLVDEAEKTANNLPTKQAQWTKFVYIPALEQVIRDSKTRLQELEASL